MHSGPAPLKTELGDFLMIIRDNAEWALMGNRKQTKFSDFWPKSAHGRIRKSSSGRLRESFETPFDWEAKRLFKSGRLREIVVMRDLTVSYRETDHNIHAYELYTLLFALILLRPTELWTTQGCETGPTVYPRRLESLTLCRYHYFRLSYLETRRVGPACDLPQSYPWLNWTNRLAVVWETRKVDYNQAGTRPQLFKRWIALSTG